MRRAIAFIAGLFLLSCLTGCMTGLSETKPVEQNGEGPLGSYYVKITDFFVTSSLSGDNVLVLSFDFTNSNSNAVSADLALQFTLFQGGIELSPAYFLIPPDGYDSTNYQKKVKDGATLNCQKAFYLRSLYSPVEVEVQRYFSFGAEMVTAKLDIAN